MTAEANKATTCRNRNVSKISKVRDCAAEEDIMGKGNVGLTPRTHHFATLFKTTSTGALQEWQISVHPESGHNGRSDSIGVITTRWGQVGGATQETTDRIRVGKNVGKKNETSPITQAYLEAKAKWEKQLKKGYSQTRADAAAGKVDSTAITGGIAPMLAHRFDEHGHKLVYPCHVQPKLNGHRCIALVRAGKCTLWSRTRKPITSLPHIVAAVEEHSRAVAGDDADFDFDGELYVHDKVLFEKLTSLIRPTEPVEGHEVVQYHVYDLPSACGAKFNARLVALTAQFAVALTLLGPARARAFPLRLVETAYALDEDDLMAAFARFVEAGYEGAMARNADGLYVNKRSYDLLKIKEFIDEEFEVLGVEEGRGKLAGHAIFVCDANNDIKPGPSGDQEQLPFRVKLKGPTAKLKEYFDHPEKVIGKMLTVKYQNRSALDIPIFPVGVGFKEEL